MIIKASERGGSLGLARHLTRLDENEHVELHEVRGFLSSDINGAMKEAYAVSRGTRAKNFLFSASLNPPPDQTPGVEVFEDAIKRIEERTGLTGHAKIVVFHEKQGRRHCHAVWSRVNPETMRAVNIPHWKIKLRDLSRDIFHEQDWLLPPGYIRTTDHDRRNYSLAQYQEAKRKGPSARELQDVIRDCWQASDTRAAFENALKARGLVLARGDRRAHVVLTTEGQVLGVARSTGRRVKEIKARLGDSDCLPGVDEAKAQIAKNMSAAFKRHAAEARQHKSRDLAAFEARRLAMTEAHRAERAKLDAGIEARRIEETKRRSERLHARGLKAIWSRLTGEHARVSKENEREAYAAFRRDRDQRQSLIEAQLAERRALQAEIMASRNRHAEQLKEIRRDAAPYQERGIHKASPESLSRQFEQATPAPRVQVPSIEERLQSVRARTRKPRDKGLEHER
jgi:hypothetical protein